MTEVDLVMQRLADADPAPADDVVPGAQANSALFDTICERSGGMSNTAEAPWWRRGPVVALAVFLLIVGSAAVILAAGADSTEDVAGGDGEATVPSVSATAAPATTTVPELQPRDHALALLAARYGADADPMVWSGFLVDDSPAFEPIEWDWLDDFDGDGVVAFADWMQFQIALNGATGTNAEYECETVSEDTARCAVTHTDHFYERGGATPPATEMLMTFSAGKLSGEEVVEPADAAQHEHLDGQAEDGRYLALSHY
nr:hypothetical protein [Acidimicrobiia bacterium]